MNGSKPIVVRISGYPGRGRLVFLSMSAYQYYRLGSGLYVKFVNEWNKVIAEGVIKNVYFTNLQSVSPEDARLGGFRDADALYDYLSRRLKSDNFVKLEIEPVVSSEVKPVQESMEFEESEYVDWAGILNVMKKAYETKEFLLVIGPAGTGKTAAVREFAKMVGKELITINFSLRTREAHLVGTRELHNGSTLFKEGLLVKSMREGSILYLDELNAAPPEVLVRLDEALDDRRQIVLKEGSGEIVKAVEDWWVVATVNPLGFAGTTELPHQILSRFPVRFYLSYPQEEIEKEIVEKRLGQKLPDEFLRIIKVIKKIRESAAAGILPYTPTIRESIAIGKLILAGMDARKALDHVIGQVYSLWGTEVSQSVEEIIWSAFGEGG